MAPARNSPTITVKVVSARGVSSSKGADALLTSCVTVALPLGAAEPACTETVAESAEPEFNFSTSLDVVADDAALTTLVATPVTFTLNELEKDEKVPRATATLSLAPLLGASSIAEAWLPLAAADGAEGEMGELLVSVEATGALLTEDQFEESTVLTVGVAGLYALPPSWQLAEGQGEADHLFTYDASIELAGGAAFALSGGAIAPPAALPTALQRRWRAAFGCEFCGDTRAVVCPNCDGVGGYTAMGGVDVACKACRGTGRVVCRDCFTGDGYDIEGIRRRLGVPD